MMKKKIFGFVLLGAFAMFALSTVTSCKKYDDDICALQDNDTKIEAALVATTTALNAEITSLQSQLDAAKADLSTATAAAKAAADKAQAAADKAQTAADDAKASALAAGKSAADAQAAADAAQAAAVKAQATADEALAKAVAEAQRAAAAEAALQAKIDNLEKTLNGELKTLKSDLAQLKSDLAAQGKSAEASALAVKALLEKNVTEIYAKINAVDEALTKDLKAVSDRVTTAEQDIANLKAQFDLQAKTLGEYKTSLDELAKKVANNETAIAAIQAAITADEAKIAALETLTATLAANKADKSDVEALATTVKEIAAALENKADKDLAANLQAELNKLAETVVALAGTVETNKAAAEAAAESLQNQINTLMSLVNSKANASDVQAAITKVNESIKKVESELGQKITSLETAVKALQDTYVTEASLKAALEKYNTAIQKLQDDKADKTAVTQEIADAFQAFKDGDFKTLAEKVDNNFLTLDLKVGTLNNKLDSLYGELVEVDKTLATKEALKDSIAMVQSNIAFVADTLTANMEAIKVDLQNQINDINDALSELEGYLKGLITGITLERTYAGHGYDGYVSGNLVLGEKLATQVVFPYDGASGAETYPASSYLVNTSNVKIYATINPSGVDFTGSKLELINSRNELHKSFEVDSLVASNYLLTEAIAAKAEVAKVGNGFYEMKLNALDEYITASPKDDHVLYALSAVYNGVNGQQRVTSQYALNFSEVVKAAKSAAGIEYFAYKDAACTKPCTGRIGINWYELVGDSVCYLKSDVKGETDSIFKFYIDYDATDWLTAPEKKVYEAAAAKDVYKFVIDTTQINQPTAVTFYILDYNGNIRKCEKTIGFTKPLIKPFEVNVTAYPGHSQNFGSQKWALAVADDSLKAALGDNLALFVANADSLSLMSSHSCVSKDSILFTKNKAELTIYYNPATCDINKAMPLTFKVYNANRGGDGVGQFVTEFTVNLTVKGPNHLDSYVKGLPTKIPAAFNVHEKGMLRTQFWTMNIWNHYQNTLEQSFNFASKTTTLVPDATVAGLGNWTKSHGSVYEFVCDNPDVKQIVKDGNPWYLEYPKNVISVMSDKKGAEGTQVYVDNMSSYKDSDFVVTFTQRINYYNMNRYYSAETGLNNQFEAQFYDFINYGIYKKAHLRTATPNVDAVVVSNKGSFTLPSDFYIFDKYTEIPALKDGINIKTSDAVTAWGVDFTDTSKDAPLVSNFQFDPTTCKVTFDFGGSLMTQPIVYKAQVYVLDYYGVKTVQEMTFTLKGTSAKKQ